MVVDDFAALEAALLASGKLELQLQQQLLSFPHKIRKLALAGEDSNADALEAAYKKARHRLEQVRAEIHKLEAKLYSRR